MGRTECWLALLGRSDSRRTLGHTDSRRNLIYYHQWTLPPSATSAGTGPLVPQIGEEGQSLGLTSNTSAWMLKSYRPLGGVKGRAWDRLPLCQLKPWASALMVHFSSWCRVGGRQAWPKCSCGEPVFSGPCVEGRGFPRRLPLHHPARKSERQQEAWELEMASLPRHVPRPPAGRLPSSHFGCLPVLCVVSSCGWGGSCHCSWGIWGRRWRGRTLAGTRGCPVRGHGFAGSGLPCSTGWEWFRHVLEQTGGQHQLRLLVTPQPFYSIYLI